MKPRVYYNDNEEYVCNWLANLMLAGLIPEGDIDQRSIRDVKPDDLRGYTQCHFFAGIGGWAFALQLAGWPDDREVWTGSCPCQPFSVAGKQKGFDDERHLWPDFAALIEKRRPPTLFGEQVAGAPAWLNVVRSDLEKMDYAVGAIPIEAASAGADHFRDRYFFVADRTFVAEREPQHGLQSESRSRSRPDAGGSGAGRDEAGGMAYGYGYGSDAGRGNDGEVRGVQEAQCQSEQRAALPGGSGQRNPDGSMAYGYGYGEQSGKGLQRSGQFGGTGCDQGNNCRALPDDDDQRSQKPQRLAGDAGTQCAPAAGGRVCVVEYGHDAERRPESAGGHVAVGDTSRWLKSDDDDTESGAWGPLWTEQQFRSAGFTAAVAHIGRRQYIHCPDDKWRRLPPPRVRWLGNGIPARVAKLRAIGNAIDPRPAAAFVKAFLACRP